MSIDKSVFYYDLPKRLIAQKPLAERSSSRLMVMNRETGAFTHRKFRDIIEYINAGDCLVLNDTRVMPARLIGNRETGAQIELLLLKRLDTALTESQCTSPAFAEWEALARPARRFREGEEISFGGGILKARAIRAFDGGIRHIRLEYDGVFEEILDQLGEMPLPPYITEKLPDKSRYQTVYAENTGSAAAPTAGFHFTPELLGLLTDKGVKIAKITLHVGLGTFRPIKTNDILEHKMHFEHYSVSCEAAETVNSARSKGGRIIAVGTTSVRTLETAGQGGVLRAGAGDTDIFIYPGYKFKITDGLITNFHLPESTLMALVSAFAGTENIMGAYNEAVAEEYRFFSFGDAMFIV